MRLKRLVHAVETLRAKPPGVSAATGNEHVERLDQAMSDDLNTPRALTVLDDLLGDRQLSPETRLRLLVAFDDVLGLDVATLTRADLRTRPAEATIAEADIAAQLSDRRAARVAKDFARSDAIRDVLSAAGVEVMDGDPLGWDWRLPSGQPAP